MNGKKLLLIVLVLLAVVALFVTLVFLMPMNQPDSGPKALEPDPMHQPSTN